MVMGTCLHPASIDRHADITLTPTKLVLVYEVVLGINATEKAARMLDPNNDGEITNEDREKFLQEAPPNMPVRMIFCWHRSP